MTVFYTEEMMRLSDLINTWRQSGEWKENTPPEIFEAKKRFDILYKEQYELALSLL